MLKYVAYLHAICITFSSKYLVDVELVTGAFHSVAIVKDNHDVCRRSQGLEGEDDVTLTIEEGHRTRIQERYVLDLSVHDYRVVEDVGIDIVTDDHLKLKATLMEFYKSCNLQFVLPCTHLRVSQKE